MRRRQSEIHRSIAPEAFVAASVLLRLSGGDRPARWPEQGCFIGRVASWLGLRSTSRSLPVRPVAMEWIINVEHVRKKLGRWMLLSDLADAGKIRFCFVTLRMH